MTLRLERRGAGAPGGRPGRVVWVVWVVWAWSIAALLAVAAPAARGETVRVVAGGDVVFGRAAPTGWRPVGGDDPFGGGAAALLRAADLAIVNLETPVCDALPPVPGGAGPLVRFRAPPAAARVLAAAGIDAVSLANNHALDGGADGLRTTLAHLEAAGVAAVGAAFDRDPGAPVLFDAGSVPVALLAATHHVNRGTRRERPRHPVAQHSWAVLRDDLPRRVARARADFPHAAIVVLVHWGGEDTPRPARAQIDLGHALVDAGAALVVGHGAHALQPVEAFGDGVIVYGAGDLVFDRTRPSGARDRALFEATLVRAPGGRWRADRLAVHPLAGTALDDLLRVSAERFGTHLRPEGGALVWRR